MAATYFTCTLGQADSLGLTTKSFKNISIDFIPVGETFAQE